MCMRQKEHIPVAGCLPRCPAVRAPALPGGGKARVLVDAVGKRICFSDNLSS